MPTAQTDHKPSQWVCIDFGTCNTAAAIDVDGKPHVVTFAGSGFFPTVACISDDGTMQVCQSAESMRTLHPEGFIQEYKLCIHQPLGIYGRQYQDVVAETLRFVKGCAETENNGHAISSVLLTLPASYTPDDQRRRVMADAAAAAGFTTVDFLTEPEAAAHHYAYVMGRRVKGLSLVYDLGGGTFDAVLLDTSDAKHPRIVGTESGTAMGGSYFDSAIYKYVKEQCAAAGTPLLRDHRLDDYLSCRRLKETLSVQRQAEQPFSCGKGVTLTRQEFDRLVAANIHKTVETCESMLRTARRNWKDISQVLFVGGSTAIPLVATMLRKAMEAAGATGVTLVRNTTGRHGSYDHRFATCLGGIATKITPPPPPPEPLAQLWMGSRRLQLHQGLNTFGRDRSNEFCFPDDPTMSRKHFDINVTRDTAGRWNYLLTTRSQTKPTIINGLLALDLNSAFTKSSEYLQDSWMITAGRTTLTFVKPTVKKAGAQ